MSAIGSWKVTMTTPAGPQDMRLHIDTLADTFTGRIESPLGNHDIAGSVEAGTLRWQMKASKPIPITVTFHAQIDGDTLRGGAKLGFLGKSVLSGERLQTAAAQAPAVDLDAVGEITGDSLDPRYNRPYIDVNELRSEPLPHRYVHGGFTGTDARFSFYFPPAEQYRRRFFHNTYPMATSEDIGPFPIEFEVSTGNLAFTFDSGAYYVQTNLGGQDRAGIADPAIGAYRVNAAAAKHSRVVAAELYGAHRPYGYIFGGSGGSYQVIGCAENTRGVWDGFLPFVMATPNAIPSMFTVRMHALRVLQRRKRLPDIFDAIAPGGSGDPYAGLDDDEKAALREATRMGFPPRGWWSYETLDSGYFMQVAPLIPMLDPTYVDDFWTQPGYLGSDPHANLAALRFSFDTSIRAVTPGFPPQFELSDVPARDFRNAHLRIVDGEHAGRSVPIARIDGHRIGFAFAADQALLNSVRAGDRVRIDNAWALALETYHRHQVPTPDLCGWDQFRDADGTPIHPQRDILIGPIGAAGTAGTVPNGRIHGRMLVLEALMDIDALAWQADWYRTKVKDALGAQFDEQFAIWFIDHAQHDNPQTPAAHAHTVSYEGALQQGLRDLANWVENGIKPSSTRYEVVDAQVVVPDDAVARGGIQPLVTLHANGGVRSEVAVGDAVAFSARIDVPPHAGRVVAAEWDFEGLGTYPQHETLTPQASLQLSATHRYDKPGVYFAVLRATSQREGDAQTPFGRIRNLARVRVVVHE